MIGDIEGFLGKENIEKIEERPDLKPVRKIDGLSLGNYVLINFTAETKMIPELEKNVKEIEEKKISRTYLKLEVPNPSIINATIILSCTVKKEIVERVQNELQKDDIVEIYGYLRNEKKKKNNFPISDKLEFSENENREIVVQVTEFNKLEIKFEEINRENSNQVRLIGKIITDFEEGGEVGTLNYHIRFKIEVPREGNPSPLFFCRVHGEAITYFKNELKKGDIILLEGFLQSKKIIFTPLKEFARIFKNTTIEIDFSKPKDKSSINASAKGVEYIDYKDKDNLIKFINRQGRIVHHTHTQLAAKVQRQIAKSIKRARQMALLPYMIIEQNEEEIKK
nr:12613_t:CDS:2 [Entrophospora candida]